VPRLRSRRRRPRPARSCGGRTRREAHRGHVPRPRGHATHHVARQLRAQLCSRRAATSPRAARRRGAGRGGAAPRGEQRDGSLGRLAALLVLKVVQEPAGQTAVKHGQTWSNAEHAEPRRATRSQRSARPRCWPQAWSRAPAAELRTKLHPGRDTWRAGCRVAHEAAPGAGHVAAAAEVAGGAAGRRRGAADPARVQTKWRACSGGGRADSAGESESARVCPLSTGRGTRRVHLVRGKGGGGGGLRFVTWYVVAGPIIFFLRSGPSRSTWGRARRS
jgi:hypothetical protein